MDSLKLIIRHDNNRSFPDFVITGKLHVANDISQLQLDPDNFYIKEGAQLPDFPHYEIEIYSEESGLLNHEHMKKIHLHQSDKTQADFICWTARISTKEVAQQIFRLWCVGTVFTLINGEDFAKSFFEHKSTEAFLDFMADTHGLRVVSETTNN